MAEQNLVLDPHQLPRTARHFHARPEHSPHRLPTDRRGQVVDLAPGPHHLAQRELGNVADVDRLHTPARITGGEDPAALRGAAQPPRQAAHVLPRPEQHPRAEQARPGQPEGLRHRAFGTGLPASVVGVDPRPSVRQPLGIQGRVGRGLPHRRVDVQGFGGPPLVHRHRGHIHIAVDYGLQGPGARQHVTRTERGGRGVDHRVPRTVRGQPGEVLGPLPVTVQRGRTRHRLSGATSREGAHVPATRQRAGHDGRAKEPTTAQDQNPHRGRSCHPSLPERTPEVHRSLPATAVPCGWTAANGQAPRQPRPPIPRYDRVPWGAMPKG